MSPTTTATERKVAGRPPHRQAENITLSAGAWNTPDKDILSRRQTRLQWRYSLPVRCALRDRSHMATASIKIFNNTDHVLYMPTDGLLRVEVQVGVIFLLLARHPQRHFHGGHLCDSRQRNGTSGRCPASRCSSATGIDHQVTNPNSFDLSKADFEWYDISHPLPIWI